MCGGWVSDSGFTETRSSLGRDGIKLGVREGHVLWGPGLSSLSPFWVSWDKSLNPSECQTLWLKSMINNAKFLRLYKVSSLFYVNFQQMPGMQ